MSIIIILSDGLAKQCNLLKKASASVRKIRPSEKEASVNVRARKVLKKQTKE